MKRTILTIKTGECRFPITDKPPHVFCGEPVGDESTPYCIEHHVLCHNGYGKDPRSLEEMIYGADNSIQRTNSQSRSPDRFSKPGENTAPVDVVVRG